MALFIQTSGCITWSWVIAAEQWRCSENPHASWLDLGFCYVAVHITIRLRCIPERSHNTCLRAVTCGMIVVLTWLSCFYNCEKPKSWLTLKSDWLPSPNTHLGLAMGRLPVSRCTEALKKSVLKPLMFFLLHHFHGMSCRNPSGRVRREITPSLFY